MGNRASAAAAARMDVEREILQLTSVADTLKENAVSTRTRSRHLRMEAATYLTDGNVEASRISGGAALREERAAVKMQSTAAGIDSFVAELERVAENSKTAESMAALGEAVRRLARTRAVEDLPRTMREIRATLTVMQREAEGMDAAIERPGTADAAVGADEVRALLMQLAAENDLVGLFDAPAVVAAAPVAAPVAVTAPVAVALGAPVATATAPPPPPRTRAQAGGGGATATDADADAALRARLAALDA